MTQKTIKTARNRRSQAGYMVATALAAIAVIGGAMSMMLGATKSANEVSLSVNARAKLSTDIDTAFNYLANTGTLGGTTTTGGVTNMFYAPLPIRTEDMGKNDTPTFIGAVPQLSTVDPRGALVGYVAFYNGRDARSLHEAKKRDLQNRDPQTQLAEPIFINEDVDMAIQNNNLPALAMIAPGSNGRIDLKTEEMLKEYLLAQDSDGKYQLKSTNAMNQALSDAGIDDRVFAYSQQKSRDTQGETTANLVGSASSSCDPLTHKLIYQPRPTGGTDFVCVPEADPALVVTDGAVGGINSVLQAAPGRLQGDRTIVLRQIFGSQGVIVNGTGGSLALSFDYLQNEGLVNRFNTVNNDIQALNTRINNLNLNGGGTTITANGKNLPDIDGLLNNPNRGVVFKRVAADKLEFRTIRSADGNLQVQTTGDEIIIRNTAAATMINGRNIGGAPCGKPVIKSPTDSVDALGIITADDAQNLRNAGDKGNAPCATRELYSGKADALTLMFRRLEAGPGIVFSDGALDANRQPSIKITADAAAAGALMDVRNVGNGQTLARKNGGLVEIKSLVGINGTIVRTNGNVVEIGAVGGNGGGLTTTDVNSLINQYLTGILPSAACGNGETVSFNGTRLICVPGGNFWARNNDGSITNNNGGNVNLAANTSLSAVGASGQVTSISSNGVALSNSSGTAISLSSATGLERTQSVDINGVTYLSRITVDGKGFGVSQSNGPLGSQAGINNTGMSLSLDETNGVRTIVDLTNRGFAVNKGLASNVPGNSLFNLDYSGNSAVMTLNGRSIQPMPANNCAANEFLSFRNGELVCAAGAGGNVGTNTIVASSDIITCSSTNPQQIGSTNWVRFQFTATDCGGTLPNNSYVGAIKEAVGTNGDGSVTVLNAGQAFAGWSPAPAAGAVTGPAVVMTVGAVVNSRATAIYIRPGSAPVAGGGGPLETVTYVLNETGGNSSATSVANLNNITLAVVGGSIQNPPAATSSMLRVITNPTVDNPNNPLVAVRSNVSSSEIAGLSCPSGLTLVSCNSATKHSDGGEYDETDNYIGSDGACYADEIIREAELTSLYITCARSGTGTSGNIATASLPTCTAGQTLIANSSGQLVCTNTNTGSGTGNLPTCTAGQTLIANSSGQLVCSSPNTSANNSRGYAGTGIVEQSFTLTYPNSSTTSLQSATTLLAANAKMLMVNASCISSATNNALAIQFLNTGNSNFMQVPLCDSRLGVVNSIGKMIPVPSSAASYRIVSSRAGNINPQTASVSVLE